MRAFRRKVARSRCIMQRLLLIGGGVAVLLAGEASLTLATPGDLDPSFGEGGKVRYDLGHLQRADALVVQSDGKLVQVGYFRYESCALQTCPGETGDFVVVRYERDGQVDDAFSRVLIDFGGEDRAVAVAVQPSGSTDRARSGSPRDKLVVLGIATDRETNSGDIAVARLQADGTLDKTFGDGGKVRLDFEGHQHALALRLLPDGKVVFTAQDYSSGEYGLILVRLNADGSLDQSFGDSGTVRIASDLGAGLALLKKGRILLIGAISSGKIRLSRLRSNGTLDRTFGDDGYATVEGQAGNVHLLLPSDKLIVGGNRDPDNHPQFVLTGLRRSGRPDRRFGEGGQVVGNPGEKVTALAVQPDGKLLVGGEGRRDFMVARYLRNGQPDLMFGDEGRVFTNFLPEKVNYAEEELTGLVVQGRDRIIAGGTTPHSCTHARCQSWFTLAGYQIR